MQYQCYLKGVYFHQKVGDEHQKKALSWYTYSLKTAEVEQVFTKDKTMKSHKQVSVNYWRLMALENIEMILADKSANKNRRGTKQGSKVKVAEKPMIYQFLSHHYVLRRSVVFIVDTEFSSVFYHYMANRQVKKFFKKLDDQDYFGYISLGEKNISDQSALQMKQKNTTLQYKFLQMMGEREPKLCLEL